MTNIDVLAVMDKAIDSVNMRISPEHAAWNAELREARAAVAELIEADRALDAASRSLNETDPASEDAETMESMRLHRQRCIARRAAALAHIGGAA